MQMSQAENMQQNVPVAVELCQQGEGGHLQSLPARTGERPQAAGKDAHTHTPASDSHATALPRSAPACHTCLCGTEPISPTRPQQVKSRFIHSSQESDRCTTAANPMTEHHSAFKTSTTLPHAQCGEFHTSKKGQLGGPGAGDCLAI